MARKTPDRKATAHRWLLAALGGILAFGALFGAELQAWYKTIDPMHARLIGGSISLAIVVFAVWAVIYAYRKPKA